MSKESSSQIHYTITPANPAAHIYRVTCKIAKPNPKGQVLSMPAWIPGSYMIRDFARNVVSLNATCHDQEISVTKLNKDQWQCEPCTSELTIYYEVYAWDLSVRTAHLDTNHAYFNGTSVFLQVNGQETQPCSVDIFAPEGEQYSNWRVATSMPTAGAECYGFGRYQARDYDELVDHPVEISDFSLATFSAGNIPHDIVITGRHRADMERLCQDLKKICETHISMFGELPEIKRYVFLVMAVGDGYGGLEHRASTSLLCSRNDLPLASQPQVSEGYRTFLGLCSHEYFHTWNVKRIKPAGFMPYDLSRESYTRQLWAFEGITSYYDDLGLLRSGVISKDSYLEMLGQTITRVWRGSGRKKQSVADSSFDAWTKFYKQDESAPNNIVSYYTKGSLIALALDLTIRKFSNNHSSLDNLMQRIWQEYGKTQTGVPEGRIETMASEISGTDLNDFFSRYLYNTEDIPLNDLLAEFGIIFSLRAATNADDKGGTKTETNLDSEPVYLGARVVNQPSGAKLSHVFDSSPALKAGLSAGDVVIALNNIKVDKGNFEKQLSNHSPGEEVLLHYFRRDELFSTILTLEQAPLDTCYLLDTENKTAEMERLHKSWLSG